MSATKHRQRHSSNPLPIHTDLHTVISMNHISTPLGIPADSTCVESALESGFENSRITQIPLPGFLSVYWLIVYDAA